MSLPITATPVIPSPATAAPVAAERRLTPSTAWVRYFRQNAAHLRAIPWHLGHGAATPAQLALIIPSLKAWQLGETSDGAHLLAAAREYAREVGDPEFVEAVKLFIAEEQRHGECLGCCVDLAGEVRARRNWGDTLFRRLRYLLPSMEVWATPVVMVETHALIYYRALHNASPSPILRAVCGQILRDEVPHIRFQCERLAILHRRRSALAYALTMTWHRLFFAAITIAVWCGHHRTLRAGGFPFRRFWRSNWRRMRYAWHLMHPGLYGQATTIGTAAVAAAAPATSHPRTS